MVKDEYTRPDGSKMEVNYYVEPAWENSAKKVLDAYTDFNLC